MARRDDSTDTMTHLAEFSACFEWDSGPVVEGDFRGFRALGASEEPNEQIMILCSHKSMRNESKLPVGGF